MGESGEVRRGHDHRGVLEPLVVIDRLPHVEQHRRMLEHLHEERRRPRDRGRRSAAPASDDRRSATVTFHVAKRAASVAAEIVRTCRGEGIDGQVTQCERPPGALDSRPPRRSAPRCRIAASTTSAPPTIESARSGLSPRSRARRFIVRAARSSMIALEVAPPGARIRAGAATDDRSGEDRSSRGSAPCLRSRPDHRRHRARAHPSFLERRGHRLAQVLHLALRAAGPKRGTDRSRGGTRTGTSRIDRTADRGSS